MEHYLHIIEMSKIIFIQNQTKQPNFLDIIWVGKVVSNSGSFFITVVLRHTTDRSVDPVLTCLYMNHLPYILTYNASF